MPNMSGHESFRLVYLVISSFLTIFLFTVGSFIPFLNFWGILLCPVPLALLGCRLGYRWLSAGVGLTMLLILLILPATAVVYYFLARMPISVALYTVAFIKLKTGGEGLLICAIIALLAELAYILVFYQITGRNVLLPDLSQIEAAVSHLQGSLEPSQVQTLQVTVQQMAALIPHLLPSMVMIYAGTDAILNYKLCTYFASRSTCRPPLLPAFTEWRLPRSLLPALCFAFLTGIIAGWQQWFDVIMFTMNLKIVLNILFYIQGISLACWWMAHRKFGPVLRCVLFVLMLFPLLWLWIVTLGVMDMLLDFRTRVMTKARKKF